MSFLQLLKAFTTKLFPPNVLQLLGGLAPALRPYADACFKLLLSTVYINKFGYVIRRLEGHINALLIRDFIKEKSPVASKSSRVSILHIVVSKLNNPRIQEDVLV